MAEELGKCIENLKKEIASVWSHTVDRPMAILGVECVTLKHTSEMSTGLDLLEIIFPDYASGGWGGVDCFFQLKLEETSDIRSKTLDLRKGKYSSGCYLILGVEKPRVLPNRNLQLCNLIISHCQDAFKPAS